MTLFQSDVVFSGQGPTLREQFEVKVRIAYQEILTALKRRKPDLFALSNKYQQTKAQDYFHCELDRIGCAWLIRKWIDPQAKIVFIAVGTWELPTGVEPFDIPGTRLSHHQGHCSFHAFEREYQMDDAVLRRIARIIDDADTVQQVRIKPAAVTAFARTAGLEITAVATCRNTEGWWCHKRLRRIDATSFV